jgi:hypothetical protein
MPGFRVLLLLLVLSTASSAQTTRFSTGSGNWSNPNAWGGTVPSPADCVVINHYIFFDQDHIMDGPGGTGFLYVTSNGELCGPHHLKGQFVHYGPITVDSITIYAPSNSYAYLSTTNGMHIYTTGASWSNNGNGFCGGCPPSCGKNDVAEATVNSIRNTSRPNPVTDQLNIDLVLSRQGTVSLELYDAAGRLVMYRSFENPDVGPFTITLNTDALQDGVYAYRLRSGNDEGWGKLVKRY